MPLFSNTGIELVERTARILRDWKGDTITGGTASTFVDTTRTEADDYFQNTVPVSRIRIITTTDNATPIRQERTISDWTSSSSTGVVSANWTTGYPQVGDTYCIMSEYSWEEIFHAINDTFDSVKKLAVLEKVDTSIVLVTSIYEYDIPAGFTHIYRISMDDGAGHFPEVVPPDQYRIIRGTPTPRIHFLTYPTVTVPDGMYYTPYWADDQLTNDRAIRIEGLGYQGTLVNDTDLCYLDQIFVNNLAASLLHV